jgi:hypothetical protein
MKELVRAVNTVEIIGVLDQIQKVNHIIDIHQLYEEESMVREFERQRAGFLEELEVLLASMRIKAQLTVLAA